MMPQKAPSWIQHARDHEKSLMDDVDENDDDGVPFSERTGHASVTLSHACCTDWTFSYKKPSSSSSDSDSQNRPTWVLLQKQQDLHQDDEETVALSDASFSSEESNEAEESSRIQNPLPESSCYSSSEPLRDSSSCNTRSIHHQLPDFCLGNDCLWDHIRESLEAMVPREDWPCHWWDRTVYAPYSNQDDHSTNGNPPEDDSSASWTTLSNLVQTYLVNSQLITQNPTSDLADVSSIKRKNDLSSALDELQRKREQSIAAATYIQRIVRRFLCQKRYALQRKAVRIIQTFVRQAMALLSSSTADALQWWEEIDFASDTLSSSSFSPRAILSIQHDEETWHPPSQVQITLTPMHRLFATDPLASPSNKTVDPYGSLLLEDDDDGALYDKRHHDMAVFAIQLELTALDNVLI